MRALLVVLTVLSFNSLIISKEYDGNNLEWKGGDVVKGPGGGFKINLLKEALNEYHNRDDLIIVFVDSYDVVFMQSKQELLRKYKNFGAKVVFSAERFCWPDLKLSNFYPHVGVSEYRFLNSGGFMGPASYLYEIVNYYPIEDDDDDQLYYTNIYLNNDLKKNLDIQLDSQSKIFQNLNGALDDVKVQYDEKSGYIVNKIFGTKPVILHGNGPIKVKFNSLTNYLAQSWTPTHGCQHCDDDRNIFLNNYSDYPNILLAIFIEQPTPFLEVFFKRVAKLTYPKSKMHLIVHIMANASFQRNAFQQFNETFGSEYTSVIWLDEHLSESEATRKAFAYCLGIEDCQFVFLLDGIVQLTYNQVIEHLVTMNKSIIAPLVTLRGKLWSNFWGDINSDGFYQRSNDYLDIVEGTIRGIWNVPFVRSVYLASRSAVRQLIEFDEEIDTDMDIAKHARNHYIFIFVDNRESFGHLINSENYTNEHLHNDMWQMLYNPLDWEERYVHPDYLKLLNSTPKMEDFEQPCPDVFWFPLLSELFCQQLIEEMENYGQWSGGTNIDTRLEGGYENVPTRDIHMRQVNFEEQWIQFLQKYVYPVQQIIFEGYNDEPRARMNFIVKYDMKGQTSLRPHHDSSSYTINIALNRKGIDYTGGGVKYVRYNCSIIDTRLGWSVASPGRVTHLHEGLLLTSGTRYIFVTFINP